MRRFYIETILIVVSVKGLEPDTLRCLIPECQENPSNASILDFGPDIFWHEENGDIDYCRRYPVSNDHTTSEQCKQADFNITKLEKD